MQKNFLRLLHLGENTFWDMVYQVAQLSEEQEAMWRKSLRQVPVHLWCGDTHDAQVQVFLKVFEGLGISYIEHQCTGFDLAALSEAAEKHAEACVHVACGFSQTQLDILSSEGGGAWLNGYGVKSVPWAAIAEIALIQSLVEENKALSLESFRVCWLGGVDALGQSLIEAAIYAPIELFMGIPPQKDPEHHETGLALKAGAKIFLTREPELALDDAQLIYLDATLEQRALEAEKNGKELPRIPLSMESFSWENGFCLTAEYMARATDTVRIVSSLVGARVQNMDTLLQLRRQNMRRHALWAALHHVANALKI